MRFSWFIALFLLLGCDGLPEEQAVQNPVCFVICFSTITDAEVKTDGPTTISQSNSTGAIN